MKASAASLPTFAISSPTFVLRTPLLPLDEFVGWGADVTALAHLDETHAQFLEAYTRDRQALRARLRDVIERPEVFEALFLASPSLATTLQSWREHPDSARGEKAERALVKYFSRMSTRCTPFGLFSGCAVGRVSDTSSLSFDARERYGRHTRLDMDYLFALTEAVGRDPVFRRELTYTPNGSLYEAAGQIHYVESRLAGKARTHHLTAIERSKHVDTALRAAYAGARWEDVVDALVNAHADEEITKDEAEEFVNDLIDSQILVATLTPPLTGAEPLGVVCGEIEQLPSGAAIATVLATVDSELREMDRHHIGVPAERYESLAAQLGTLPAPAELRTLFQVDMTKPMVADQLGQAVVDEVLKGVDLMYRIARPPDDAFPAFQRAFEDRYGDRAVPLLEVADDEVGIGFPASRSDGNRDEPPPWTGADAALLNLFTRAIDERAGEVVLTEDDIAALSTGTAAPDCVHTMFSVASDSNAALASGDFSILLKGAAGPSGARMLGRFCHVHPDIDRLVREHLRDDTSDNSEMVFAELVHLGEGRQGNVLCRPVLRAREIVYVGRSGAPPDQQLPVSDLLVSVEGNRVILRSARDGREIVPRLTSAHNFGHPNALPVYKFLGALQAQRLSGWGGWTWGHLGFTPFTPRVRWGRLILTRAQWHLRQRDLRALAEPSDSVARFRAVQQFRKRLRLPRLVEVVDSGDNGLAVDLDNALSVESFTHLVKDRAIVMLTELFPDPRRLICRGPEGGFANEFILTLKRTTRTGTPAPPYVRTQVAAATRLRAPGSDWLYAKLYCGPASIDRVLRALSPVIARVVSDGLTDRWFFLRYRDPDCHLRLRFHTCTSQMRSGLMAALECAVNSLLTSGIVWRFQLDTYEREVLRYGGEHGIELAEQLFSADSEAVLSILDQCESDELDKYRWFFTLLGIDRLLTDFGLDATAKMSFAQRAAERGSGGHHQGTAAKQHLSELYRTGRAQIETILGSADRVADLAVVHGAFARRSTATSRVAQRLRQLETQASLTGPLLSIVRSFTHLHANRLLRQDPVRQEHMAYDALYRYHQSQVARGKRTASAGVLANQT